MRKRERKQIEFNCTQGTPEARARHCAEAMIVLRQDLERLREKAAALCAEFGATLEAHSSRLVNGVVRPRAIAQDVREARLVKTVAWGLTIVDVMLSFFLAIVFLANPFFAVALALAAVWSMKAGLLALWRNDAQPQWTRRQLRRWVIAPSLVVTLLSAAVLIFTRGVLGWLALLLAPFVMAALCTLSFGVLGLAAGLFGLGYLLSWSRHAERRFDALEREAVATRRTLERVTRIAEELRAMQAGATAANARQGVAQGASARGSLLDGGVVISATPSSSVSRVPVVPSATALQRQEAVSPAITQPPGHHGRGASWLPLLLLLGLALGSGGCSTTAAFQPAMQNSAPPAPTTAAATSTPAAPPTTTGDANTPTVLPAEAILLDIWLDWSLSADAAPYRETVRALVAALPDLTARHRIGRITARQFGDRGWSAPELFRLDLPRPSTPGRGNEAKVIFGEMREEEHRRDAARYDAEVCAALAAITPERLLPANAPEPPCTDLQGALNRIAVDARPQRRLVFLLTDGAESCARGLRPVALSQANAALVIVVLPEEQTPGTTGRAALRPDDLWRQRRAELQAAAPGALIVPHFADLSGAANAVLTTNNRRDQ